MAHITGQQAQRENSWYSRWLVHQWLSPVLSGKPGRTMENSLTRERSSCKMSSLTFTLIYHFTGVVLFSVCLQKPASISVIQSIFKYFYDKICFFVHWVVFVLFGSNPVNQKSTNSANEMLKIPTIQGMNKLWVLMSRSSDCKFAKLTSQQTERA